MGLLPFERNLRKIIVKRSASTNPKYGQNPLKRPIDELITFGVIAINKPSGPTSHQVSAYVQQILGIKKSGHSGTLDPKVTGVLPVALGNATRIVQALLPAGKEYIALMHLHQEVPEESIRKVMAGFVGKIKQLPPIKSSVKRQHRFRKVYYIEILDIIGKDVLFKVGTQAGTYIRKLCHDIGVALGTGAHMAELIRTKAGPFNAQEMYTLQELRDAFYYYNEENNERFIRQVIKPVEAAVQHLPKIWVLDSAIDALTHGVNLAVPGIVKLESDISPKDLVAVMSLKDELIALGISKMTSLEISKQERGIAVETSKVFMRPGLYPRVNKEMS
jgi:H/ACA ribonucleoprotein complex subunit 4